MTLDTSEDGFQINAKKLAAAVTPRTKAIVLTSPNNPTGCVLDEKSLDAVADLASRSGFYVVCDDVYEELEYGEGLRGHGFARLHPELADRTIVVNSPEYYKKMTDWLELRLEDHPEVEQYVSQALETLSNQLMDIVNNRLLPSMGSVLSSLTTGVFAALKGVYNLIVGIIVSIYLLANREIAKAGFRKVLYSVFSIETAEKIRAGLVFTDKTFMGFLSGKLLDSAIIGLICYIVCAILKMPYTLLVSVIIGLTNIIPFFGPLIGAVPSAFIILLVDPLKCLIFVVFIVVLQQIDGNIIGPKILGSTVGINGFWVMFSIILGGGLFSFAGMILGVPVFVVLYTALSALVDKQLRRNDLPQDFDTYARLDYIDAATREVHLKKDGN